ncbi:MAG: M48 family metalloprotease [Gammaproteobacteria bacterium]
MRPALLAAALTTAVALAGTSVAPAPAQDSRLPDIGSSAGTLISPAEQERYGAMLLSQLRHYGYTLDDPLLEGWLQQLGARLAATSDRPGQSFTFFLLKDRKINAFATLGGYIGMNAGLVLEARREDEVAAVLAHEIAHVTQLHVLRAVERAQRDSIPILLAMLGAIAVAQSAGGSSSGDATQAAIAVGAGLMQQRQIDYTRSNESEADRIGIQTLARGGYDPEAMAGFFERMMTAGRGNSGGYQAPDFLRTHPVTTTRISEARQRVEQIRRAPRFTPEPVAGSSNPLLPGGMELPRSIARDGGGSGRFDLARERLRVLSADTAAAAVREYAQIRASAGGLDPAQRYGLAVAQMRDNANAEAIAALAALLAERPGDAWIELTLAEAEARAGRREAADRRFESLLARMPRDRAVAITYAAALAERNDPAAGRRAQDVLRPLQAAAAADPSFQRTFARASEVAGDPVRAGEAWAEVAFLTGRPEQALLQLETLKKRPDVDYYARARIDARIAAITPVVLELRRQGVRDEVLRRG